MEHVDRRSEYRVRVDKFCECYFGVVVRITDFRIEDIHRATVHKFPEVSSEFLDWRDAVEYLVVSDFGERHMMNSDASNIMAVLGKFETRKDDEDCAAMCLPTQLSNVCCDRRDDIQRVFPKAAAWYEAKRDLVFIFDVIGDGPSVEEALLTLEIGRDVFAKGIYGEFAHTVPSAYITVQRELMPECKRATLHCIVT